jgi:Uma2 family endonuclease
MLLKRVAGQTWVVRMEMAFRPTPEYEVWRADVGCISRQRHAATGDDEYIMGAPDLIVEVLSPGNTVDEMNDKMSICLANGCVSFWVVDPKRKLVSVTEGNITRHYGPSDAISCSLFTGQIQVREIFE